MKIIDKELVFLDDQLEGEEIVHAERKLSDIAGIFQDESARASMDQDQFAYEVDCHFPVEEGTLGGLFFGITKLYPGKVGDEYFMTKGHFHAESERAEYYWGIKGHGVLILMDRDGNTWGEKMYPGSLHYIPSHIAHRVANVGDELLSFGACWPSDAGHDYETIATDGFTARLKEVDGVPTLIPSK
ncbi:glucose-6-phosphate isomerase [Labilibacter sediminis]|nr:glucose-6-phosphate isomerase [Labilibacter sediminis]